MLDLENTRCYDFPLKYTLKYLCEFYIYQSSMSLGLLEYFLQQKRGLKNRLIKKYLNNFSKSLGCITKFKIIIRN